MAAADGGTLAGPSPRARTSTPPAVAPPPGNPRFPLVDGVRALAVLSILLYHVSFATGANLTGTVGPLLSRLHVGVAIFFVISGFLLYRPFLAARRGQGSPDRHRRVPAPAPAPHRPGLLGRPHAARDLARASGGVHRRLVGRTTASYRSTRTRPTCRGSGPPGATWSLATEMAFYLTLPVFASWPPRRSPAAPRTRTLAVAGARPAGPSSTSARSAFRAWTPPQRRSARPPPGSAARARSTGSPSGWRLAVASVGARRDRPRAPRAPAPRATASLRGLGRGRGTVRPARLGHRPPDHLPLHSHLPGSLRRSTSPSMPADGAGRTARGGARRARRPDRRRRARAAPLPPRRVPRAHLVRHLPVARPRSCRSWPSVECPTDSSRSWCSRSPRSPSWSRSPRSATTWSRSRSCASSTAGRGGRRPRGSAVQLSPAKSKRAPLPRLALIDRSPEPSPARSTLTSPPAGRCRGCRGRTRAARHPAAPATLTGRPVGRQRRRQDEGECAAGQAPAEPPSPCPA